MSPKPRSENGQRERTSSAKGGDNGLPTFVKCELSDTDRKAVQGEILAPERGFEFVNELAVSRIKVSFGYEQQNDCVAVYATGSRDAISDYAGYCLTARGPDCLSALTVLAYKHFNILKQDWSQSNVDASHVKWG